MGTQLINASSQIHAFSRISTEGVYSFWESVKSVFSNKICAFYNISEQMRV